MQIPGRIKEHTQETKELRCISFAVQKRAARKAAFLDMTPQEKGTRILRLPVPNKFRLELVGGRLMKRYWTK